MNDCCPIPSLRFKSFADAWEQCELNQVTDVRDGTHESPKYVNEGFPFITSKNVKDGYINYDDIQYITKNDFDNINKRSKVDINDILMGMIGTIGNLALIRQEPDFAIKNVALIKDIGKVNYKYLYQYLQSTNTLKQLQDGLDGGTQKFVSLSRVRSLSVWSPSLNEQTVIGEFLDSFDSLITLHQRKYDKLVNIKKALLDKMLPKDGEKKPRIRFKGFTDTWEQCELGKITIIKKGEQLSIKDFHDNGKYYVLNGGINPSGYSDKYNTESDTISISEGGNSCGYVNYNSENFWSGGHNYTLVKPTIDVKFLYQQLKCKQDVVMSLRVGSGLPNIQRGPLEEFSIEFPNKQEQLKIGSLFNTLDNLITLHQRKCEKLNNIKKSLLEKMFI